MIFHARTACMLIALLFLVVAPIQGAGYIKIGNIEGESTAPMYEEWIVTDAFEWIKPAPGDVLTGDPEGVVLPDIRIRKRIDKSSPFLMRFNGLLLSAEQGLTPFPPKTNVTYVQVLPTGDGASQPFMIWELRDVWIKGYSISGDTGARPTEEVTLSFGSARQTVFQYDTDGDLIDTQTQGFVLRDGSTIPPPPDGSTIDSFTISELPQGAETKVTADGLAMSEDEEANNDI